MREWQKALAAAIPAALLFGCLTMYFCGCCCKWRTSSSKQKQQQKGIQKPNVRYGDGSRNRVRSYQWSPARGPSFDWADHPSLVAEAVENGWTAFAFATPPAPVSSRWILCTGGGGSAQPEFSWEIGPASLDYMQKIRLNPQIDSTRSNKNWADRSVSVVRGALPLPGPPLGSLTFPQEAYFEVTVFTTPPDSCSPERRLAEGESVSLISEAGMKSESDTLYDVEKQSGIKNRGLNQTNSVPVVDEEGWLTKVIAVGLTHGGDTAYANGVPGTHPCGSVGFHSTGSVYLNGMKINRSLESQGMARWGEKETVLGCGFNPSQRKVFFTLDSNLIHTADCKLPEFGKPLYPTLAANCEVRLMVNYGQSPFGYAPSNASRTPNPGLTLRPTSSMARTLDSTELFSMGRIDSQWLSSPGPGDLIESEAWRIDSQWLSRPGPGDLVESEAETELFEIVLDDGNGRIIKRKEATSESFNE
ncbi:hypothetical protein AMTRI_Chr13g121620 [Amborella trichopoda]